MCLVSGEILHVIPNGLLGDLVVLTKYIKVFESEVAHLDFRVVNFEIPESVDGSVPAKNVFGTEKNDVELLQVAVFFAPVQGFAIAHGLVEAGPFGDFLGVGHLHFDVKTAEGFAVGTDFLRKDVKADTLGDGAYVDGLFRFGVAKFMNLDAENRFQEGLGDFLVAEDHREHELVGDGQLIKGNIIVFHF